MSLPLKITHDPKRPERFWEPVGWQIRAALGTLFCPIATVHLADGPAEWPQDQPQASRAATLLASAPDLFQAARTALDTLCRSADPGIHITDWTFHLSQALLWNEEGFTQVAPPLELPVTWRLSTPLSPDDGFVILDEAQSPIAFVHQGHVPVPIPGGFIRPVSHEEAHANALLMTAAPQLATAIAQASYAALTGTFCGNRGLCALLQSATSAASIGFPSSMTYYAQSRPQTITPCLAIAG